MAMFDSKSFNPQAFGAYVDRIPNTKKTELASSRAVGSNASARNALASQTGSLYARVPYFGRISGSTSQNNDGGTNIQSSNTFTFEQGFVTASRMDSWTEKSFSANITSGVDFMDNVAAQLADYKAEVKQDMLMSILKGVYSMDTASDTVAAAAADEFISKHTYDITDSDTNTMSMSTLNSAMQKACGDNKSIFKMVIMHSQVQTNLENLGLLEYSKYTDKNGIQSSVTLTTWNGRTVLVDDSVPTEKVPVTYKKTADEALAEGKTYYTRSGSSGNYVYTAVSTPDAANIGSYYEGDTFVTKYTTYVLGEGSIILDDIGDSVPYEMNRDPKTNGGQDTLYVRDRYICGVQGISFEKDGSITASASNSDLAKGANWNVINDGSKSIPTKSIAIAKIVSLG